MNVLEGVGLNKFFGRVAAVRNLNVSISENKITGIIGPNGAGKTTLLRMIAGFTLPSAGELTVFGRNPFNSLQVSTNMIYIDDDIPLPSRMAIADILETAGEFYPNWDGKLAAGLIQYFDLDTRKSYPALSKGKKSTFAVILGISAHCPLTIFDEPTSGMDAAVRKDFYRALLKDYLNHPRTILLSSHLLNEIEDILEDVLLIHQGAKLLHMPVTDLKEYAVGLRGKADTVLNLFDGHEVVHKEHYGKDSIYVVIVNVDREVIAQKAKAEGLEVQTVNTSDLCVYLTANRGGGIDDVFAGS